MDVSIITQDDVLRSSVEAIELQHTEAEHTIYAQLPGSCDIQAGDSIGFLDVDGRYRLFEISSRTLREPEGVWEIDGIDKAIRELMDEPLTEVRARGISVTDFATRLLQNTRFSLGTVASVSTGTMTAYYESVWSALARVNDSFSVQIVPHYVLENGLITQRLVDILSKEADYRGRIFELGDDLTGISLAYDDSQIKTALYGRGKGVEIDSGDDNDPAYGRRLTFSEASWSTADGDPADKPSGQEWIGDPEALAMFGRGGRHRFGYVVFDDVTDPEELLQRTWDYLQTVREPLISITATVRDTEKLLGRAHEAVRQGDAVMVRMVRMVGDKKTTTDIHARVVGIVRDYVHPELTQITIGNAVKSSGDIISRLSQTITDYQSRAAVWDRANAFDLNGVMDVINNQITSSVGGWYTDPTTGAIMLVNAEGTQAMRLTGAGWQIASSKVGGVWQWRTAATGAGLVADMITTGVLNAGLVTVGGTGTTLDGTSLTVMHPSISDTAKTVIDETGLKMMDNGKNIGGLFRVDDTVMAAVSSLFNPAQAKQRIEVTPDLFEGKNGLAFYGAADEDETFINALMGSLTWGVDKISMVSEDYSTGLWQSLLSLSKNSALLESKGRAWLIGGANTATPIQLILNDDEKAPLKIITGYWEIRSSGSTQTPERSLFLTSKDERVSISLNRATGDITFTFVDSSGSVSTRTMREIDDALGHG